MASPSTEVEVGMCSEAWFLLPPVSLDPRTEAVVVARHPHSGRGRRVWAGRPGRVDVAPGFERNQGQEGAESNPTHSTTHEHLQLAFTASEPEPMRPSGCNAR